MNKYARLEDIHLFSNILSEKERKRLIEVTKPLLLEGSKLAEIYGHCVGYPGKQTNSNIHLNPEFENIHSEILRLSRKYLLKNFEVERSWVNWTNGKKKDINWHTHHTPYAAVYYMKHLPIFTNGTLFKMQVNDKVRTKFFKAPQNSAIVFPAQLLHTAPSSPLRVDRYTLAINLGFK